MKTTTSYRGNESIITTTDTISGMILTVERKILPECNDQECMQLRRRYSLGSCYAPNAIGDHWRWYDFVTLS